MMIGTVKWFNVEQGHGFIAPDGADKDVFVEAADVQKEGGVLSEGERVSFDLETEDNAPTAVNVRSAA